LSKWEEVGDKSGKEKKGKRRRCRQREKRKRNVVARKFGRGTAESREMAISPSFPFPPINSVQVSKRYA
jgi:hypothetical protein